MASVFRRLAIVVVSAGIVSMLWPPAVPSAGATVGSARAYFRPCDELLYRPTHVQLACGDGNFGLDRMRWRGWNGPTAHGSGVAYYNDCEPDCADGHFHRYGVSVTLGRRSRCPGTRLQYLRIDVHEVGRGTRRSTMSLECDGSYDLQS